MKRRIDRELVFLIGYLWAIIGGFWILPYILGYPEPNRMVVAALSLFMLLLWGQHISDWFDKW